MKADSRREFGAVPIVVGMLCVLFLLFAAAVLGVWAWLITGLLLVTAGAVLLGVWTSRRRHATGPAPSRRTVDDGVHRVLVIADGPATPDELRDRLVRGDRPTRAFVVAPALGSRVAQWTGDEDAYTGAEASLEATLRALEEIGVEATGRIGAHDPIQAADDGLRQFPADEVLFATHPEGESAWLEDGVVEVAVDRYDVPVAHVVIESR